MRGIGTLTSKSWSISLIAIPLDRFCSRFLHGERTTFASTIFAISVIYSDVPIVVQHTRLNSRQEALALPSTIAYASN